MSDYKGWTACVLFPAAMELLHLTHYPDPLHDPLIFVSSRHLRLFT